MLRFVLSALLVAGVSSNAWAQQPCSTDTRRVVDELYRHVLERDADPGSATWVTRLASGTTVREMVRELAKSPEHMRRFANPSEGPEAAVSILYRHVLGRQPDPAGLTMYTQQAKTQGLASVIDALSSSREYNQDFGDWGLPGSGGLRYCAPARRR